MEAKAGLFGLAEVSDLGVMAEKLKLVDGRAEIDEPIFIPWGSVHSIRLFAAEEVEEDDD